MSIPTTYASTPPLFTSGSGSSSLYFGIYNDRIDDSLRTQLWEVFIDTYFPASESGMFNEALNTASSGDTWYPQELAEHSEFRIVEGIFGSALKDFFYSYAQDNSLNAASSNSDFSEAFASYLTSAAKSTAANKQSTILLWVWEVLVQLLERFHDTSPTKGGYALAMADAEKAAVSLLASIEFEEQTSSADYGTQRNNMQAQQDAELYRAYRSIVGKRGQDAQGMITTTRDTASSHSQLMASIIQTMESMIQSIIKR